MKLRIEISETEPEGEVIIRCGRVDDNVKKIQEFILSLSTPKLTFYKGTQEFFLPIEEVLFFETADEQIFAHTVNDSFKVRYRLYELEEMLPRSFARAAKGTIVNTHAIYAINRNMSSASKISFQGTHKHIYVSRHYYNALKDKMNERST